MVEILIAVFVFFMAVAMLTGSFASFIKTYTNAKKAQRDVENAQYAMNLMAKTIRTSALVSSDSSITDFPLNIYDYSQEICVQYKYNQTDKKIQIGSITPATENDPSSCQFESIATFSDLTAGDINSVAITAVPSNGYVLGKATIMLGVRDPSQATPIIPIQMSVSLRQ